MWLSQLCNKVPKSPLLCVETLGINPCVLSINLSRPQLPTYINIQPTKHEAYDRSVRMLPSNNKKKSHVGATVKAVINVLLKINMIYKGTLFGAKEYFRPLGVPCIERYL